MPQSGSRSVLVAGATGLVGAECVRLLLADPDVDRVVVLTRRPLTADSGKVKDVQKLEERRVNFDQLDADADVFNVDQIICALGTTIRKAGSREQFRRVDYEYPVEIARLGAARGVRHFLLVSAIGARSRSRFFYSRVKGDVEGAIASVPFRSVSIVRPSLLMGERTEFRLGEELAKRLRFLFPRSMKPIHASSVAAALAELARLDQPGTRVAETVELERLARAYRER